MKRVIISMILCMALTIIMTACVSGVDDSETERGAVKETMTEQVEQETVVETEQETVVETEQETKSEKIDNPFELERFTEFLLADYARGMVIGENCPEPPADLVFPQYEWCKYRFVGDEQGIYTVEIPSADGKYMIKLTIDGGNTSKDDESEMSPYLLNVEFVQK